MKLFGERVKRNLMTHTLVEMAVYEHCKRNWAMTSECFTIHRFSHSYQPKSASKSSASISVLESGLLGQGHCINGQWGLVHDSARLGMRI